MFIGYQQVVADATVKTSTALNQTYLAKCNGAMLQADTQDVHYTMDDSTNPTAGTGMILKVGLAPEFFQSDDLRRIRFTRGPTVGSLLNIHFSVGRDIP